MKTTHFPCVKGMMGDWIYYITVMEVTDVVHYVQYAEEVCPSKDLDLMIQREIGARSKQIAEYLRTQDQRFFGSLIVAAYDGEPKFLPISFADTPLLSQLEGKVGILQFDGSEQYYAVDGQHRLAALKTVVEQDAARYKADQVSVIVICHAKNAEGMARARRLFTTVNRYAKRTSPVTNIVMDEDDGLAVISRRLIREIPFFSTRIKVLTRPSKGKTRLARGEAMQPSDRQYLMAVGTLYKCNKNLLPKTLSQAFAKSQQLPDFDALEKGFVAISKRWKELIENIEPLRRLEDMATDLDEVRTIKGGHVLARPVGLVSFTKAAGEALDVGISVSVIKRCVTEYSDLDKTPWAGLFWNTTSRRMSVSQERVNIATAVWRLLMGLHSDYSAVNAEWRATVDPRDEDQRLKLPRITKRLTSKRSLQ
jgi:DNA sulfur modification protein DndB